jgi:hypothetical protein
MRRNAIWIGALAMLFGTTLPAQDIAGDWEGTLKAGPQELASSLQSTNLPTESGTALSAALTKVRIGGARTPIDSITLQGSNLKFAIAAVRGTYEGKLSTDGASIDGAWTQGRPLPLEFRRATPKTAWKDRRHIPCSS